MIYFEISFMISNFVSNGKEGHRLTRKCSMMTRYFSRHSFISNKSISINRSTPGSVADKLTSQPLTHSWCWISMLAKSAYIFGSGPIPKSHALARPISGEPARRISSSIQLELAIRVRTQLMHGGRRISQRMYVDAAVERDDAVIFDKLSSWVSTRRNLFPFKLDFKHEFWETSWIFQSNERNKHSLFGTSYYKDTYSRKFHSNRKCCFDSDSMLLFVPIIMSIRKILFFVSIVNQEDVDDVSKRWWTMNPYGDADVLAFCHRWSRRFVIAVVPINVPYIGEVNSKVLTLESISREWWAKVICDVDSTWRRDFLNWSWDWFSINFSGVVL